MFEPFILSNVVLSNNVLSEETLSGELLGNAAPNAQAADRSATGEPRLRLRSATERGGFVDGGWWPRSLDLAGELPAMITALIDAGCTVHKVSYNLTGWQIPPSKLTVGGSVLTLTGHRNQSRSSITLIDTANTNSATVSRLELVVVPPDTDPIIAERALQMAGKDGLRLRSAEILMRAKSR